MFLPNRRKRLLFKQDELSHKSSKISNNSANSGNNTNVNLDDTNGTDNGLIDSSSTLTFGGGGGGGGQCLNSKSALFFDATQAGHLMLDSSLPIPYKHINQNQRHSSGLFLGELDSKLQKTVNLEQIKSLMYAHKTLSHTSHNQQRFSNQNQNFKHANTLAQSQSLANKNALLLSDPLSHIYETISVSSMCNGNPHLNQHQISQNRVTRNLYNSQNTQFRPPPPPPPQASSSTNQYIELDSQLVNARGRHLANNEMMLFGYDSTNEHSTTSSSSADYSSSQQSQDSYLKIIPSSHSSNLAMTNRLLANNFNSRNHNQTQQSGFVNTSNQAASPAASSSQSLLTTANTNDFDTSNYRQNTLHPHQFQQQNRHIAVNNSINKEDYLQPDLINVNFLNNKQLGNSKNTGHSSILFSNRIEAVVWGTCFNQQMSDFNLVSNQKCDIV